MTEESRRYREDAALRTEQRLMDFIGAYEQDKKLTMEKYAEDKKASIEWRAKVDARLQPLEKMYETLSTPAAVVKWCLIIMLTPVLSWFGFEVIKKMLMAVQRMAFDVPR